jgi:hypothetical protein
VDEDTLRERRWVVDGAFSGENGRGEEIFPTTRKRKKSIETRKK